MFDLPDLERILAFEKPILEMILRGTLMYLGLFGLLRVTLKREAGGLGITNLLLVVLLADAAQNAMADDYHSIADGAVLVCTILFWSMALDWLGYRFPRSVGRFIHPQPLPLIEDGRLIRRNLRQELITRDELMTQLRLAGIEEISEVRRAHMEGNGEISVVRFENGEARASGSGESPEGDR